MLVASPYLDMFFWASTVVALYCIALCRILLYCVSDRFIFVPSRELHSLLQSQGPVTGANHSQLEGGIFFGIGAFNLVRLNTFPFGHNRTNPYIHYRYLGYPWSILAFKPPFVINNDFQPFILLKHRHNSGNLRLGIIISNKCYYFSIIIILSLTRIVTLRLLPLFQQWGPIYFNACLNVNVFIIFQVIPLFIHAYLNVIKLFYSYFASYSNGHQYQSLRMEGASVQCCC